MNKGINIWSFSENKTIEECIIIARNAGFDGIELALNETGDLSLLSSNDEILEYRRLAEKNEIQLPSLSTGLYWTYSLTSLNPDSREKAVDIVRKQIQMAAILGADTILVLPGMVSADFIENAEIVPYDIVYALLLDAMQKLIPYAEKHNITIALENVWNKFFLSPLEVRDFIDQLESEYLGVYLDVGNTLLTGYPEHWIRILGSRIKKVHLKDFRRSVGTISGFVDLLAGDVDFVRVMEALSETGYDDFLTAEMIPPYLQYSDQLIFNTSQSMDRILSLTP